MMNKRVRTKIKKKTVVCSVRGQLLVFVMMRAMPGMSGKIAKIAERRQEQAAVTAWWGTLYPKFCFSQFPEENKGQKDDIKISFWLAQALDW